MPTSLGRGQLFFLLLTLGWICNLTVTMETQRFGTRSGGKSLSFWKLFLECLKGHGRQLCCGDAWPGMVQGTGSRWPCGLTALTWDAGVLLPGSAQPPPLHDPRYLSRLRYKNTGADLGAHPGSESWDSALVRPVGGDSPGAPPWSGDGKRSFWATRLCCPVQGQPVSLGGTCELPLLRLEAPKAPRNYGN